MTDSSLIGKERIYISRAEVQYILDYMRRHDSSYVCIEHESTPIWHNLWVKAMPYGHCERIPEQQEDMDNN